MVLLEIENVPYINNDPEDEEEESFYEEGKVVQRYFLCLKSVY